MFPDGEMAGFIEQENLSRGANLFLKAVDS